MTISACPIAVVDAPVEHVWSFLSEPRNYARWWDAETRSITPEGRAQTGQKIYAKTAAFGKQWDVIVAVEGLDEANRQIHLRTALLFGITVYNHVKCSVLANRTTQVSFG